MIERLAELVNGDAALTHRARWMSADMLLGVGETDYMVRIRDGKITACAPVDEQPVPFDFAIRGTADAWAEFWKPVPKPRHHDISALIREGKMHIEGNVPLAMAHFLTIKLMLQKPRTLAQNARATA